MLTPTGAKLLHFGLAKPAAPKKSAALLTAVTHLFAEPWRASNSGPRYT